MRIVLSGLLLAVAAVAVAQDAAVKPPPVSQADRLAAESLRNSALNMLHSPATTPLRAARLVALTKFSERLLSGDPQTHMLFAQIYQSQEEPALAAGAAEVYLKAYPWDQRMGEVWLKLRLAGFEDAAGRLAFLETVTEREDLPETLRAYAAVFAGTTYLGQGEIEKTKVALNKALELDPSQPEALQTLTSIDENMDPVMGMQSLLGRLRTNPGDFGSVMTLATMLDSTGLHEQSEEILAFLGKITAGQGSDLQGSFMKRRFDVLLSMGRSDLVIEMFQDRQEQAGIDFGTSLLLIEAYRVQDRPDKADELISKFQQRYDEAEEGGIMPVWMASEQAWLNLVFAGKPAKALAGARELLAKDPNDSLAELMIGMAQVALGQGETAKGRLRPLQDDDIYANIAIAQQFFREGDTFSARQAIEKGAGLDRTGHGFRLLKTVAAFRGIQVPPKPEAAELIALYEAFDKRYLDVGLEPQKYVSVTLKTLKPTLMVGEPVEIEATLTNNAPVALVLDSQYGMLAANLALVVELDGKRGTSFANLPLLTWPAPRYLQPGASISHKIRIDTGELGIFLARRPLKELTLKVQGVLSPRLADGSFASAMPGVKITPLQIKIKSLLRPFDRNNLGQWAKAYQLALAYVVADIQKGGLPTRMRAARQVGTLLAMIREIEKHTIRPPWQLKQRINKGMLLRMMIEVLKDPSEAVRAEMIAALSKVDVDASIIKYLGPAIKDSSALVRLRVAELLGGSGVAGQEPVLKFLAKDSDAIVQLMAKAALEAGQQQVAETFPD